MLTLVSAGVLALASSAVASPVSRSTKPTVLTGPARRSLTPAGRDLSEIFDIGFWNAERDHTAKKYQLTLQAYHNNTAAGRVKRAVGNVALQDDISGTTDVEYCEPQVLCPSASSMQREDDVMIN